MQLPQLWKDVRGPLHPPIKRVVNFPLDTDVPKHAGLWVYILELTGLFVGRMVREKKNVVIRGSFVEFDMVPNWSELCIPSGEEE